jgi:YgiT-type zinc finger domain-containing protein
MLSGSERPIGSSYGSSKRLCRPAKSSRIIQMIPVGQAVWYWDLLVHDLSMRCAVCKRILRSFSSLQCMILPSGQSYGRTLTDGERGEPVSRVYHRCHFCGGEVVEQRVTVDYRWGDALLVVIRNVPAGVCQVCGEQYLKAEVVKALEKVAHSKEEAKEMLLIPVRELQVA